MLATLRIEKLAPSESLKPALQAYVDGQLLANLILKIITR
jgi:hypothetical protein